MLLITTYKIKDNINQPIYIKGIYKLINIYTKIYIIRLY